MMRSKLMTLFLCFAFAINLSAQLRIKSDGLEINYAVDSISYAFSVDTLLSAPIIKSFNQSNNKGFWQPLLNNKKNLNHLSTSVWFKIPVSSILKYHSFKYLQINNPHINYIQCWIVNKDSIIKTFKQTGDNTNFNTRPIPNSAFVFDINAADYKNCFIIIMADKRYSNLEMPINFCSENYYISQTQSINIVLGIIIGLGLFIIFLNISLYLVIKQSLYIWYTLFQSMLLIYLCTDQGLLFKYLYPFHPELNDLIRPAAFILSIVPLIQFFNRIVELPKHFPKLYLFNQWLTLGFLIVFVVSMASSIAGSYKIQGYWLYASRILSPLLMLTLMFESIYCYYKKLRYANFSMISFIGTNIFISIYSLHQNDLVTDNFFTAKSNYWGFFWETMVMAIALAWRYNYYKNQSELLYKKNQDQQERIFKEIVDYQEKEMQRISSLLHDSVGANLGLLRLETDNMLLTEDGRNRLAQNITSLGNEVRKMSHSFSPILLQDKGLFKAVEEWITQINLNSNINIQFEWIGPKLQILDQYEIIVYRIVQEIVQNILKHSKSTNAFLQIMTAQNLIAIYAEDDGVGMSNKNEITGVGLKSIKKMVEILDGSFKIETSENNGFNISIEFNQLLHEKN